MIAHAVRDGFARAARAWGLAGVLLLVNLLTAALLALPLVVILESALRESDAATGMLYGFDFPWWSQWSDSQPGWPAGFHPDIFGVGFAFKNLDLLLSGAVPASLFPSPGRPPGETRSVDPVIFGLVLLYLLLQAFLAGGLIGALRGAQGGWTVRGFLHGSGFYFGRLFRVMLLVLLADALLFLLNVPFARWANHQAEEAVSERTAVVWVFGRHAALLLALLFVHLVSSYARVIVVLEERSSALLALLSSASFCLRHFVRAAGHLLAIAAAGVILLATWAWLDGHWTTTGYKTQVVSLLLAEGLLFGRIFLRLALVGGQMTLYQRLAGSEG